MIFTICEKISKGVKNEILLSIIWAKKNFEKSRNLMSNTIIVEFSYFFAYYLLYIIIYSFINSLRYQVKIVELMQYICLDLCSG